MPMVLVVPPTGAFPGDDERPGEDEAMQRITVEYCVETICNKGCQAVRDDIRALERGEVVAELKELSEPLRQAVLRELKSIMAVYGDSCRI